MTRVEIIIEIDEAAKPEVPPTYNARETLIRAIQHTAMQFSFLRRVRATSMDRVITMHRGGAISLAARNAPNGRVIGKVTLRVTDAVC